MLTCGAISSRADVLRAKKSLCRKHGLARVPANYELLALVPGGIRGDVEHLLRNKPVRTASGVAPVAVMTSPADCPHGRCSYCPGGVPNSSPQSYTGREPAALRASMHGFDPYDQTKARLEQLFAIGHRTDKVDLIIMGGTFTARPVDYQEWFVKRCFDAMNGCDAPDLASSQEANETARSRCTGLTVETRPDWFRREHVERAISLGATKVELGVQVLDDRVLEGVKRGHGVEAVTEATALAKEAGLKVCYHIMPGLPGSTAEGDMRSFALMFSDERFRPDMLKIYPTLVVKGTELYDWWRDGRYEPMSLEGSVVLIEQMKKATPRWVRILRVQRDIPVQLIEAGVRKGHLREIVAEHLALKDKRCPCIRCMEAGHRGVPGRGDAGAGLTIEDDSYRASGGTESFISASSEDDDCLVGYARLRLSDREGMSRARLRELHVYGEMVPLDEGPDGRWQHRGIGARLLSLCESKAADAGFDGLFVTSGVGVRDYYRRLGYEREGMYMVKKLTTRGTSTV
ncbi:MAG: tRNA uridine(34) 5-carboxymethylaminomethyl modification radical SAM/GNAT enzyme Elp3 [Methanobacteriota archaeon]|nr:MAG: tRNA uridine(34) 5-carboxymethylaminomethyl modification radical SAM/GNAT enzyme Elp3 [Euryarchaeota archaeon]